ncbi:MAG: hypothetical protein J0I23_04810 [Rhizobiales bacterium]|nr:hypothetical protein [Hyphomicrobiales bacterium]
MDNVRQFFLDHVVPAHEEYLVAEQNLSTEHSLGAWAEEPATRAALSAIRHASNLAISIDGLGDRAALSLGLSRREILDNVQPLCLFKPEGVERRGCIERIRGVANAYKHDRLSDQSLPITSSEDVLVVGLGYGLDGFGIGKMGAPEVIVRMKDGIKRKFLGDARCAMNGWRTFLGI